MIFAIFFVTGALLVDGKTYHTQESWQTGGDEPSRHVSSRSLVQHWENVLAKGKCGFPMFTCHVSEVCLYSLSELCDGRDNCQHGEDEKHCTHEDKGAIAFIRNIFEVTSSPTARHTHSHNSHGHHHHEHVTKQTHSTHASHHGVSHFVPITAKPSTTSRTTFAPTQTKGTSSSTVTPHWIKFTQSTVPSVILSLLG
ncbi:uncharacterized protein LOC110446109 [Mizuhopecten yessoensis]|uniref:Uncharacterized protein n=1 Tax=Mizuhopecten yessoensis TaxID=6573 RepID=A0A210QY47_MIZYE|nr:uncharacterized protein LOC110446109 [Mizuhopecten yessoensis]OWF53669.1 hypothetical protein KP79_PYT24479 [Mizuhopecten yessoensis]